MTPKNPDQKHIKEIILHFLEGIATDREVSILQDWLEESEANRQFFDEMNNTFHATVTLHRFNHPMVENAWEKVSKIIDQPSDVTTSRQRSLYFTALKVAATVCLLAVTGAVLFNLFHDSGGQQGGTIVRSSEVNNTKILLPDSSTVWLNASSSIEYGAEFNKTAREVTLNGEAFFDVKKGGKSFIVRTENMQVHVKGTRFNVEAYNKNSNTKTTLEEGRVELYIEGSNESFTMTPGDQIIVGTEHNDIVVRKVDPSNFSAWKEEQLVFDNVPLSTILAKLENRYKVKITLQSPRAKHEMITMTIEHEDLDEVLEMIKLSSQLRAKVEKDEIVLYE